MQGSRRALADYGCIKHMCGIAGALSRHSLFEKTIANEMADEFHTSYNNLYRGSEALVVKVEHVAPG